ncbi:hypothetical protein FHS42_001194 [Streptomyces zagrosensis]|uniref:Uncharacterized protein n=1 Tax=Streptomyces zagrosensis TaxID=1042984 RepID=A0A7W9Q6Q5_9ACTN|nr:hypothetical protein [Streptomyces zagrosensis]
MRLLGVGSWPPLRPWLGGSHGPIIARPSGPIRLGTASVVAPLQSRELGAPG